jgi:crossover junction endodeoxyribonuclease RusA
MTEYLIELPWDKPPLSQNDSGRHWAKKARIIREVRTTAAWLAKQARIPACSRVRVELHYQPKVRRTRDNENLAPTSKACIDGALVDAGVVPDDCDEFVERYGPVIHPVVDGEPGRLWLVIKPLDSEGVA